MKAEYFTVTRLSEMTGSDRQTIKRHLLNVKPRNPGERLKKYAFEDLTAAMAGQDTDPGDLKAEKLREEIRKLKIANDAKEEKVILKTKVAAAIQRIIPRAMAAAEQKLVNEWPSAVAGLDVPQARIFGKRVFDDLMKSFCEFGDEFN